MPFVLAKAAEALLHPSMILLACSVAGPLLLATRHRRAATALLAGLVAFQLALAVLPLDSWLLAPLVATVVAACVMGRDTGACGAALDPGRFEG